MIAFIIYRVLRAIYVSFWFYFLPFSIVFASYYVPYLLEIREDQKTAAAINV